MYRDSFSEPGWMRALRWLTVSLRLGRLFGVEVRIYWVALVLLPLIFVGRLSGYTTAEVLVYAAAFTVGLYLVIWTHEMSHILAGRRYGIATPLITLSPLGGLAHMSTAPPDPRAELRIALAGPAVHAIWLAVLWPASLLVENGTWVPGGWRSDPLYTTGTFLFWLNVTLMGFNLLPFFPMDGGRALRSVLARRMHPNLATIRTARVGMAGAVALGVAGVVLWIVASDIWGTILILIGLSNYFACRAEIRMAEHSLGPYQHAAYRAPWEADPDAWKRSSGGARTPGARDPATPRGEERRARQAERAERAATALSVEVDRILQRVSEVGMQGLTRKERQTLLAASRRQRGD